MSWDKSHLIVGLISAVVGGLIASGVHLLTFGATYGRLSANVDSLDSRVEKLETPRPRVALGDVCLKLVEGYNDASPDSYGGKERQERFVAQMKQMGCYDMLPAIAKNPEASMGLTAPKREQP